MLCTLDILVTGCNLDLPHLNAAPYYVCRIEKRLRACGCILGFLALMPSSLITFLIISLTLNVKRVAELLKRVEE